MTGESSIYTVTVRQWEVAKQPPPDHESDQEESGNKEISSEVNQRADQMEFIKEFQEVMNKAIEQLLNKPLRRHSCQKGKPELCMEQGNHRETICQEAEKLPQHNIIRESDDKPNSIVSQEIMITDQCIQRLIRTEPEGSDHAQRKIEDTAQY